MHLEAATPRVRHRVMPGKAQVSVERYFEAFAAAVPVFGRGQVSTYILAGLGDPPEAILATCKRLVDLGVYPFVVPFVPIAGTPLESHPTPSPGLMHEILEPVAAMVVNSGLAAVNIKAGCGKCGACSSLSTYERSLRDALRTVRTVRGQ
jgi:radical SAM protein (TIGR04043 family)